MDFSTTEIKWIMGVPEEVSLFACQIRGKAKIEQFTVQSLFLGYYLKRKRFEKKIMKG